MTMYDIISKKRDGGVLTDAEIQYFVNGFTSGEIPDYQASALLMAIYFQKMNEAETLALTQAMEHSGDTLDLSGIEGIVFDKHSTGGVGDKTSLVVLPIMASLGIKMGKMSGRGLGHTGGTIDKLESFPGFHTQLTPDAFLAQLNRVGMAITSQTGNLAPADKKMYALRDVTATVGNISLIASSIMSKKLAAGAPSILLDVKTGDGALLQKEADAAALAQEMVRIGKGAGRTTIAVLTDMQQPLGCAVGNALEVQEAIRTLKGHGPEDFLQLCLELGTQILLSAGITASREDAMQMQKESIANGKALQKFAEFVQAQGGNPEDVYQESRLATASLQIPVLAKQNGFITDLKAETVGRAAIILGSGRTVKDAAIDDTVGILLRAKTGSFVSAGEELATIYASHEETVAPAAALLEQAYSFADQPAPARPLIHKVYC